MASKDVKTEEKTIAEQIAEQVKVFEDRAKTMSTAECEVTAVTFSEKDKKRQLTGKVFVAYVKQPHILTAARCMDMLIAGKQYEVGQMLFDTSVMIQESSVEIATVPKYKLGLMGRLGLLIDLELPDVKKS